MATLSSSARGPPASQVTASVAKFRCLFTHDLRRKSKRWQDGYLRYHAFNKRIMVYDEQGNFVGDHHWRSADEVQDGDELELDKGVLIEVGERISTTQTDLTNLFEKRNSSQSSPSSNNGASQPPRTTPARSSGSSQSFRSLNDLLGIRKTPIDHLVSPYEKRCLPPPLNPPVQSESERAPKRQKVAAPRNVSVENKRTESEVVDLTWPECGPSGTNESEAGVVRGTSRPEKSTSSMAPPDKPRREIAHKSQKPNPPAISRPQLPVLPKSSTDQTSKSVARVSTKGLPVEQPPKKSAVSYVPVIQDDDWEAPIKTMRMTMQKPRKKLMYSALLPSEKPSKVSLAVTEKRKQSAPKAAEPKTPSVPAPDVDSTYGEYMPSDSTQFVLEEMVHRSTSQPEPSRLPGKGTEDRHHSREANQPLSALQNLPTRRALDAPLRKSLSDPTALTASSLQMRPTLMRSALSATTEEAEPLEEGPWTSEALDLFDFWPAGRPKPGG